MRQLPESFSPCFLLFLPALRLYTVPTQAALFHNLLSFDCPFNHPNDLRPPNASPYKHLAQSAPLCNATILDAINQTCRCCFGYLLTPTLNMLILHPQFLLCSFRLLCYVFSVFLYTQVQILTNANLCPLLYAFVILPFLFGGKKI